MARTPEKKRGQKEPSVERAEEAESLAQQEERLAAFERQDEAEERDKRRDRRARAARLSALPTVSGPTQEACGLEDYMEAIAPLQDLMDFLRQNVDRMTVEEQRQLVSKMLDHVRIGIEWGSYFGGQMQQAQEELEKEREARQVGVQPLLDEVEAREEIIQEKEARIAELNETIADMAQRSVRRSTPATDTTATTNIVPRHERSAKLADPPVFHNQKEKDTLGFEAWIRQVKNKLAVNADHFPTTQAAQTYIEARLGGVAADNLQPYLRDISALQITTAEELVRHLEQEYRDPNQARHARDAYEALRMKPSDNYLRFKNEFVRLAGECGEARSSWKDQFKRRLTTTLQSNLAMAFCDPAIDFERFVQIGAEVANTLDTAFKDKQANKGTNNTRMAANKEGDQPAASKNKWQPRDGGGGGRGKPAEPRHHPDELRRLYDEARCFICKETGHVAARCPKKQGQDQMKEARFAAIEERWGDRSQKQQFGPADSEN
jgi:hypothetical protein